MTARFDFDNSYAQRLRGFYVDWQPEPAPKPELVWFNRPLAEELGIEIGGLDDAALAALFSGSRLPEGAQPLAQAYAGHQFGGFSPQLGDGRALLIGEVMDVHGQRRDIQFKGSGRTPFSRGGDGKAALGPVLREVIMGEAMHALRIPTTRALAAVKTGEPVYREGKLDGAILTRIASSHIRVGTFQFFAARGEEDRVRQLADYTIWRHFPELADRLDRYAALLEIVAQRQAMLVAQWMGVGFIHGVMNTDNMAISGETIDYGPCAFMDWYDPATVFSSIDHGGRYAYGNQPRLAQWNLARLAESILPLIDANKDRAVELATTTVNRFAENYRQCWRTVFRAKLGLQREGEDDFALAQEFLATMAGQQVDFTSAFRALSEALGGNETPLRAGYQTTALLDPWLQKWHQRLSREPELPAADRAAAMDAVNPLYIARNHKVEEALAAADAGDLHPLRQLLEALVRPFERRDGFEAFGTPAPRDAAPYRTFCGT